jgi:1,4-alpha-glucan branching enzyme
MSPRYRGRALTLLLARALSGCSDGAASTLASPDATGGATTPDGGDGIVQLETGADGAGDGASDGARDGNGATDAGGAAFFGANVVATGVRFRLWSPHASAVRVVGDFAEGSVDLHLESPAVWSATVASASAGTHYGFSIDTPDGTLTRTDPWCRDVADDGRCVVVDPSTYRWSTPSFSAARREATVVYELHVGSFTTDAAAGHGTFASTTAALASLADLGVNAIELMPTHDSGSGPMGWGYNPQLWLAPKPTLGHADDLRALVDAAHGRGISVWLDWVVNHADGSATAPLACFDGRCGGGGDGVYFFAPGMYATTPWGPRPDYTEPRVVEMLLGSLQQWTGEYRGDGVRWDSVSNIRAIDGSGVTPGGRDLLVAGNAAIHDAGAFSVAEDLKGYGAITQPSSAGGFDFDAQWDGFGYQVDGVLTASSDGARDLGAIESALTGGGASPFSRLIFTEDHDIVGNGGAWLPSKIDPGNPRSFAARRLAMIGAVFTLAAPGIPMLFAGQERLATGTFSLPATPLAPPDAAGSMAGLFFHDMIALREDRAGDVTGLTEPGVEILHRNDAAKVIAWRRFGPSGHDVIVITNLSNKAYTEYDIGVADAGPYRVRLDLDDTRYGSDFAGAEAGPIRTRAMSKDGKPNTLPLVLGAYDAKVLTR